MIETTENSASFQLESLQYWQQQLSGSSPSLDLPTDKPRRSHRTSQIASQPVELPAQLVQALTAIGEGQVDLFVTLLAAFKVLIYRYIDRPDIIVGTQVVSPDRSLADQSIYFYVNHLVLRTNLAGNPKFSEILQQTDRVFADALQHQDLPFDRLVESLEIELSPSYHPLFQVMFSLTQHNVDNRISRTADRSILSGSTDLALILTETETGIVGHLEYNQELFLVATIERMTSHFQTLLTGIAIDPTQTIDELPLLTAAERQQLLVDWNQTQTDYPDLCIHQLFEAQAKLTPTAIAIEFEQQLLTYQELNSRANQLAHYLQKLGVAPDVPVGICVERSVSLMVGLLGILKAGGAYVPLDPSYPQDRLSYMVENSQVKVLISSQQLVQTLPISNAQIVNLDTDRDKIARESADDLDSQVKLENLGYTIYTSGSTGLPKGVAMTQRALCNLTAWQIAEPTATNRPKTLQFTPISFDVSFQEIFATWCTGGTLVLVADEIRRDPFALLTLLDRVQIERLFLPFVALQQLAEIAVGQQLFPQHLTEVITAGEQLQITPAIRTFFSTLTNCTLHNHYGPSESHVVTAFTLTKPVENWPALPSIGRPIANTQIYVLDSLMQPVPIGVAGEMYIGGDCLARGYFQRPELTAERFIPTPSHLHSVGRLYKTGDLVRYLHDGNIEYLGRIDTQVKIRGFRIELGEIETLISQHPTIVQTTVILREDSPGNKRLVAYCVTNNPGQNFQTDEIQPQIDELRSFVAAKVPDYMVPNLFVILPALPMTPSGKVDRRALPTPQYTRQNSVAAFVPPQDAIELELTEIWQQILDIKSIGIQDNFFALGGHSLLAVRMLAEIAGKASQNENRIWHQKLPLATFVAAPTIEQFAKVLRQQPGSTTWSSLVPISTSGSRTPLFCIHPVGGNILEYYPLAAYLGDLQPIYGLQSIGLDGIQTPVTKIEEMAATYITAIQTIQPNGPYLLLGYSFGGLVAFEIACQLESQGQKVALVALLDNESPQLPSIRPSLPQTLGIHLRNLRQLEMNDRINYIKDRIIFRTIYRSNKNSEKEFLIANWAEPLPPEYLRVLEANFEASKDYQGKFYPGKVTLFRSAIQPINQSLFADLGWGDLADDVEVFDLPGYHSNLLKEPYIQSLAQKLKRCLEIINN